MKFWITYAAVMTGIVLGMPPFFWAYAKYFNYWAAK